MAAEIRASIGVQPVVRITMAAMIVPMEAEQIADHLEKRGSDVEAVGSAPE